jgi:FkbM family methyltransferase
MPGWHYRKAKMNIWDRCKYNIGDAVRFGPQFLLRHVSRLTGRSQTVVNVPGIGAIHVRVGESDVAAVRLIFGDKVYDVSEIRAANERLMNRYRAILKGGHKPIIVDAGANIGAASRWFERSFPDAAIIAIEPEPGNLEMLRQNVSGSTGITVVPAAIGGHPGFVRVLNDGMGWAAKTVRANEGVPIITMPEAFVKVPNGVPFIAKVDIEGFESDLFAENIDWLNDLYMVVIEPHDYKFAGMKTSRSFQSAMANHDFEIFISGDSLIYMRV